MKVRTRWTIGISGFAVAALMAGLLSRAQFVQSGGVQGQTGTRSQNGFGAGPEVDPVFAAKRLKALNADRQKSMVSDADKLLKLARQLDTEIASNPTDELTPEETRKLAEIEKLARSVKAKMAQSFGGGPSIAPPPIAPLGGPGAD
jgi:hypothetical protein